MKTTLPRGILLLLVFLLVVSNAIVFTQVVKKGSVPLLSVAFLDVGQGDAILVTGPTGIEMLIDGGRDRSVLRQLPRAMGPLDRSIDIVVATHPDADHIGGLPDVFERYQVSYFLSPGRVSDTDVYQHLEEDVLAEPSVHEVLARHGMRIHLGETAYADVLYPEDNVAQLRESNDASIVMRVVYGESEFMLTGDAPSWVEDRLVASYGDALRSDVLKAGHHGSRTATDALWLGAVNPDTVVISAGKENSYGHPHPEVLERIRESGANILSTIDEGNVVFVSDGVSIRKEPVARLFLK
jgi:competence protein ComEC